MTFRRNELEHIKLKDFEEGLEEAEARSFARFHLIVPVFAICIVAALSYGWYQRHYANTETSAVDKIPFIRKENAPIRIKPDDPGGMYIANQDKKVYDVISSRKEQQALPSVTRIIPSPEEPISRKDIVSTNQPDQEQVDLVLEEMAKNISEMKQRIDTRKNTVILDEQKQTDTIDNDAANDNEIKVYFLNSEEDEIKENKEITTNSTIDSSSQTHTTIAAKTDDDKIIRQKAIEKKQPVTTTKIIVLHPKPVPKDKPETSTLEENTSTESTMLQLGAYRSSKDVDVAWQSLKKQFPQLLSNVNYKVERADLGSKGVFFRLKAGPFSSKTKARSVCNQLREKKQGCLFVK